MTTKGTLNAYFFIKDNCETNYQHKPTMDDVREVCFELIHSGDISGDAVLVPDNKTIMGMLRELHDYNQRMEEYSREPIDWNFWG